jgi:hypothetical protein
MSAPILHRPRVAWDTALIIVAAAEAGDAKFAWFTERVETLLGTPYAQALSDSRRLLWDSDRTDAAHIEAGKWRFRLDDALAARPELMAGLHALCAEANVRLAAPLP